MSLRFSSVQRAGVLTCLFCVACTSDIAPASTPDVARLDGGSARDAAPSVDARANDAPADDASAIDASAIDASAIDAALIATPDAASDPDAAIVDSPDAAIVDSPDAVVIGPDAGFACPAGMATIPGGSFLMGDPSADDMPSQPVHGVSVSSFCLDLTEVTVAAYDACGASCSAPNTGHACNEGVVGHEAHPINCVDWNQARAYCQSRGGDLPTEAQWEYAARGSDGRTYPWGDDAPASQLCWSGGGTTRMSTCAVGSFPSGASPFGLADMAGNVWEWTLDWYAPYSGDAATFVMDPTGAPSGISHVNRGGSFGNNLEVDVRPMIRFGGRADRRLESLGFRCAHAPL